MPDVCLAIDWVLDRKLRKQSHTLRKASLAMAIIALEWRSLRTEHPASVNVREGLRVTSDLESTLLQLRGNQRFSRIHYRGAFLTGRYLPANLHHSGSRVIVKNPGFC